MTILLIVLLPFLGALLPPFAARSGRASCAAVAGAISAAALATLLSLSPAVWDGGIAAASWDWVPQIGLSLGVFVDGLGLFFACIILGIGLLIILYARNYLSREDDAGKFFAYLLLFQGAMLGIVLSDNILLLVVFWELTSLSSFLLIGFWSHKADGRQGARMALVVTGAGGLALLGGMVLLGEAAGSYALTDILHRGDVVRASPLYPAILTLVLVGAFTKSAQFPFHFWLPHAMAAPTPVSAYLHSATMVKAGIFLMARLWPVLGGTEAWFIVVTGTGLVTMLVGAWIALFKDDLKGILAHSTVSHLGLMTMLLGIGTPYAATAAVFHILNHAIFKAALFMSAGIVDHETHTRDIRSLGGLVHVMPISATLALIASAAMAGVPLFNGFLSKEMMLEAAHQTSYAGSTMMLGVLATVGALLSVAYSVRFGVGVYLGQSKAEPLEVARPHDPPVGLWLPVANLACLAVAIGVFPQQLVGGLVERTAQAVVGSRAIPEVHLAIWHGFTPALGMSLVATLGGVIAWLGWSRLEALRTALPRPDAKAVFDEAVRLAVLGARRFIDAMHTHALPRYLAVIVATLAAVGFAGFLNAEGAAGTRAMIPMTFPAIVAWVILVFACAAMAWGHSHRLFALVVTSIAGLIVSLIFLQFSAPDLALTQISVEVVATILLLLALNLLPKATPRETGALKQWRDAGIAAIAGFGIAALAYAVMTRDHSTIADYYLANAKPGGGGTNVVNVILVDFRGFDTFGEIIVLCIAALVIFAMLDTAVRGAAARRLDAMKPQLESGDAHPLLFVLATRVLLPLATVVGIFIFLRGHNQPGGGFIAGLVVSIALLMQYMASGYAWAATRRRLEAHTMLGAGVLIAGFTGVASWLFGRPFLTSTFGYVSLPVVGTFELASAMAFDLGVFLAVVGTVMLALRQISRVEARAERRAVPEGPSDIRFKREAPLPGTPAGASAIAPAQGGET